MAPSQAERDTSSSGGKIFAKASKEWTIPPRPRPGRKASEPAAKLTGKGAQNRDAQRAFRERKQDYVQELETKIKEYEAQEVQKAISLQTVSLALKAENTTLKTENARLRSLVVALGGDPTDGLPPSVEGKPNGKRKRLEKVDKGRESPETDDGGDEPVTPDGAGLSPLPSASSSKLERFYPSSQPHPYPHPNGYPAPPSTHTLPSPYFSSTSTPPSTTPSNIQIVPCGFCTQNDTCVCRIAAEQKEKAGLDALLVDPSFPVWTFNAGASGIVRKPRGKGLGSVWAIDSGIIAGSRSSDSTQVEPVSLPSCTGDPSNCPACADDPFGKAFCETFEEDEERPKEPEMIELSCCGVPGACGSHVRECGTSTGSEKEVLLLGQADRVQEKEGKHGVPRADVWRRLKSHPNATFADLSLLAAVCSRRLQTLPSTTLPSAVPDPNPSERMAEPAAHSKRRRLEVDEEGVQAALRILDARSGGGVQRDGGAVVEGLKSGRRVSEVRATLGEIPEDMSV